MNNLKTDNWYYVQAFVEGKPGGVYTICFAPNKPRAEELVSDWLVRQDYEPGVARIHYYLKNYKRDAAKMVADGNFISI